METFAAYALGRTNKYIWAQTEKGKPVYRDKAEVFEICKDGTTISKGMKTFHASRFPYTKFKVHLNYFKLGKDRSFYFPVSDESKRAGAELWKHENGMGSKFFEDAFTPSSEPAKRRRVA